MICMVHQHNVVEEHSGPTLSSTPSSIGNVRYDCSNTHFEDDEPEGEIFLLIWILFNAILTFFFFFLSFFLINLKVSFLDVLFDYI